MSDTTEVRVDWYGGKVRDLQRAAARRGLELAMEHLLGVSSELVPIEEGTLMRSGRSSVDDEDLLGMVTYSAHSSANDYDYAVRQHEDLTLDHAPGRRAKFLEDPTFDESDTMAQIVATQIRRADQ
jgi:hypothetical protein